MLESRTISGITLHFPVEEQAAAEIIAAACSRSMTLIHDLWKVPAPKDCRVYVMTHWLSFLIHSTPWPFKILYTLTFLIWVGRVQHIWRLAGGWTQVLGKRVVVGIKPARLLENSDRSIGEKIFNKIEPIERKIELITAHELTHAHTLPLKLPSWLNEGLAMVTSDRLLGEATVKEETLTALATEDGLAKYPALSIQFIRGYWLVRYLLDVHPAFLSDLLVHPIRPNDVEKRIAALLQIDPKAFWRQTDAKTAEYFMSRSNTPGSAYR